MPAVKTGFGAPPMPGMPAPMGGMAPMPGMAPMGQPMGGMPMPQPMPPMGQPMPQPPMAPSMSQGGGQMQGFSMGAPRRRRFGDYLETTLGRFSQPVAADSMGQMDVFTGQMPMQAPMQRPVVGMKRGGLAGGDVEAPRRAVIKGQDHMLAYITPEEAGILKARGGWGGPGPRGIPSYPEAAAAEGGFGLGADAAFGGGVGTGSVSASDVGGTFGGGSAADFGGGGGDIGFDAFGDVYGSPAQAAVADAVAEAAATAANVGMGQAGTGGYGAQAAADVAAALGLGPSAQTSVSQPSMSVVDQLSTAMNPSAPTSMLDTFDPEVSFGMTAPGISSQSVSSPSAPSVDTSPASMSASQSVASDMAQDMAAQAAAQSVADAATQAAVDAAMDRGGISSGNFGPGIPGGTVSSADLGLGNMATVGVPGGLGSVSTNAAGSISPAQASGIVSAVGPVSGGTGTNAAANQDVSTISSEDVAMSQPVSVAPGNLAPSNAVTGLDVDMSQDVMGLLGDVTPSTVAASAPSATVSPATSTQSRGTPQSVQAGLNSLQSMVNNSGTTVSTSEQEIAAIAASSGMTMADVQQTLSLMANEQGKTVSVNPNITSSVANLDEDTSPVSVPAPAATTAAAPATTTSSPATGIAAARDAVNSTFSNMGPLSRGQIDDIAETFSVPASDVQAMVDMEQAVEAYGTPAVSAQGIAAAPSSAPAAAPSQEQAVDQGLAAVEDSAPSRSTGTATMSAPHNMPPPDEKSDQMMKSDVMPRDKVSSVVSQIAAAFTGIRGLAQTPEEAAASRAAKAIENYNETGSVYGDPQAGFEGGGPDEIRLPVATTTPTGSVDVTDPDAVGGINVPVRPVETFEDVMARISSGAPTIAPLGQPLRMQAGGAVGLNRAADSFLKALAG